MRVRDSSEARYRNVGTNKPPLKGRNLFGVCLGVDASVCLSTINILCLVYNDGCLEYVPLPCGLEHSFEFVFAFEFCSYAFFPSLLSPSTQTNLAITWLICIWRCFCAHHSMIRIQTHSTRPCHFCTLWLLAPKVKYHLHTSKPLHCVT